jgi:transposase
MTVEPGRAHNRGHRSGGVIEIDLGRGCRVRIGSDVDAAALRRVLDALESR